MKKFIKYILSCSSLAAAAPAIAAPGATTNIIRPLYNNPEIIAFEGSSGAKKRPAESKWSIGARFDLILSNFTNKYSVKSDPSDIYADDFSFVRQIGFDISAGYQFAKKWRAELNYANSGKFEDTDSTMSFNLSAQSFTLNGIYTIGEWNATSIFAGAGIGAGFLTSKLTGPSEFDHAAKTDKTSVGTAGQLQFGLEEKIADNARLGLIYKLGYLTGHAQEILLGDGDTFIVKNGGVLTNTFGLGLRVSF